MSQSPPAPGVHPPSAPWLLALSFCAALNCRAPLVATGPLLPLIIHDLRLSATNAGMLTGLPLLVMAVLSLPGGALADRLGPRRVLVLSQLVIAGAGALRGLAAGPLGILLPVVGLGAGISLAQPALVQLAQVALPRRATLATAVYTDGLILGGLAATAVSVPLLLPLAGSSSWRGAFYLWAALGLAVALGAAAMGDPGGPAPVRSSVPGPGLRDLRAVPGLLPLSVVYGGMTAIFYAIYTWLPAYYVSSGWPLAMASDPLNVYSLAAVIGCTLSPALVRWGRGTRRPLFWSSAVTTLGLIGLVLVPAAAYPWTALVGAGTAVIFTLGLAAPAELAPREWVGTAAGLLLCLGYFGACLGPLIFGALRDVIGGYEAGLGFLVLVSVAMLGACAAVPREKRAGA